MGTRGGYTVRVLTHSRWWCLFFLPMGKKCSWYLGTNFEVGGCDFHMEEESSWYQGTNFTLIQQDLTSFNRPYSSSERFRLAHIIKELRMNIGDVI